MFCPCVESPSNRKVFTYKPAQDREVNKQLSIAVCTCLQDFLHPSLLTLEVSITADTDGWVGEDCHAACWSN
ncbi:hypothetical protein XENOCAPTIV_028014 [Xenoophorus captivus]|uniref:Uncharacterized protein n=1 Tax=Xenoophorus captivus TaxID=1517983 RepID=A0ABV0Q6J2_9TELE